MPIRRQRLWVGTSLILLLCAAGAQAQGQPPAPAPPAKGTNITEIDPNSGLTGSGAVFGNGFTGPTVTLGVASGGITNTMLAGSIDPTKINGTAATLGANSFVGNQSIAGNGSITGYLNLGGNLNLPGTTSSSVGVIALGVDQSGNPLPFMHSYPGIATSGAVIGNTFLGQFAGNFHMSVPSTEVNGNTGIGYAALTALDSGTGNTGTGYLALGRTTSGFGNTALGLQAGFGNTTGTYNIAIGLSALELNTDGSNNVVIGYGAGSAANSTSIHDNVYIGNGVGSAAVENNTMRIGGSSQTKTFIAGINGVTTGGAAVAVVVDSNGQLGTVSSSRRFKYDIHPMEDTTSKLLQLRPVTFRYRQAQNDGSHPLQYGLIAEEVADVYPELVQYDEKTGEPNSVLYHVLPAMLLNEFQKEHLVVQAQQDQIRALQQQVAELTELARELRTVVAASAGKPEGALKIAAIGAK